MITTDYQPTVELKIKRSESKDFCPYCGAKNLRSFYYEECSDFDNCDYCREYEEEGDED
jgi:hypothetical protein